MTTSYIVVRAVVSSRRQISLRLYYLLLFVCLPASSTLTQKHIVTHQVDECVSCLDLQRASISSAVHQSVDKAVRNKIHYKVSVTVLIGIHRSCWCYVYGKSGCGCVYTFYFYTYLFGNVPSLSTALTQIYLHCLPAHT